ncbi:hypothetical protein BD410DRAFT_783651 [Rickenella mellea]|uniref:Uncharacterized protein n=1 Tax=Rickenella mellea TaxID=50990 RepID=A0A4Y7QG04_9AGAM|nr:hypothetical protein BD410DRAFT_783651 [Rickenella mellea]
MYYWLIQNFADISKQAESNWSLNVYQFTNVRVLFIRCWFARIHPIIPGFYIVGMTDVLRVAGLTN